MRCRKTMRGPPAGGGNENSPGGSASSAPQPGLARRERRSQDLPAHLSQRGPDALFGLTGLPLAPALLPLEPLQRCQKPRRFWLAIDHGDHSFRVSPAWGWLVLLLGRPRRLGDSGSL